jgi:hypothetical protein
MPVDEFDRWLVEGTTAPAAAPISAAAPASASWFVGTTSSLFSSRGASELLGQLPGTSAVMASGLFTDVAGRVRATIEENVTAFRREADEFCTEEAQRAEQAELSKLVAKVGDTVGVAMSSAKAPPAAGSGTPSAAELSTTWLDAPPQLRSSLEQAVLALSQNESSFSTLPPELPPPPSSPHIACPGETTDAEELEFLTGCARSALAFDPDLRQRRFELVPSKLSEELFWCNYFTRVLRERRLLMLPPLRLPRASGSVGLPPSTAASTGQPDLSAELLGKEHNAPLGAGETEVFDLAEVEAEADRLLELSAGGELAKRTAAAANASPARAVQPASPPPRHAPRQGTGTPTDAPTPPTVGLSRVEFPPEPKQPAAVASATVASATVASATVVSATGTVPANTSSASASVAVEDIACVLAAPTAPLPAYPPAISAPGPAAAPAAPATVTTLDELDAKIAAELDGLEEEGSSEESGVLLDRDALLQADEDFENVLSDDL